MSARHYLAVDEPLDRLLAGGALRRYVLKPLSFALRWQHLHVHGTYVRRLDDLTRLHPVLAGTEPVERLLDEVIAICEATLAPP